MSPPLQSAPKQAEIKDLGSAGAAHWWRRGWDRHAGLPACPGVGGLTSPPSLSASPSPQKHLLILPRGWSPLARALPCARTSQDLATKEIRCQLMPVYKDICHPELGRTGEEMRRCGGGREPESELLVLLLFFLVKAEYEGGSDDDIGGTQSGTDPCT